MDGYKVGTAVIILALVGLGITARYRLLAHRRTQVYDLRNASSCREDDQGNKQWKILGQKLHVVGVDAVVKLECNRIALANQN